MTAAPLRTAAILLAAVLPTGMPVRAAVAQRVPVRDLGAPVAVYAEGFSTIGSVRELKDGRVLVVDTKERLVRVVDMAKGTATPVSRQGGGPTEYSLPGALLALAGDTTLLVDLLQRRFLMIGPDAQPLRTIPFAATSTDPMAMLKTPVLMAADGRGFGYGQSQPVSMTASGMQLSDTVALVRQRLRDGKLDTLTVLKFPSGETSMARGADGSISMRLIPHAFDPRDGFAVFPDGRVAVLRGSDYHVDWFAPDKSVRRSPPVPYDRLRVTALEKKMVMDSMRLGIEKAVKVAAGAAAQAGAAGAALQTPKVEVVEPEHWPEFLPGSPGGVRAAPDGRLWALRMSRPGSLVMQYDILDVNGKVVDAIRFPPRTALAGFGRGVLYAVRTDDDDLQYLQRYTLR